MINWNPWYGCSKCSDGCKNCYLESLSALYDKDFTEIRKSSTNFRLLWKKDEYREFIIPAGEIINVCETSDFFIEDAYDWRVEAWKMIKDRDDLNFIINTRRIKNIEDSLPTDWKDGYENVTIIFNVSSQKDFDENIEIFKKIKCKHKKIHFSPLIEKINIIDFLDDSIEEVFVSGEYGKGARICNFDWILDIRNQCEIKNISFSFSSTGTYFYKDGKKHFIKTNDMKFEADFLDINYKKTLGD